MEPVAVPSSHEASSPHLLSSHSTSTSLLTHELKRQANVLSTPSLLQSSPTSSQTNLAVGAEQARSKSMIAAHKASLTLQTESDSPELGPLSASAPHHSLSPLTLNQPNGSSAGSTHATSAASPILNRTDSKTAASRSYNPSKIGLVAYSEGARDDYDPDQYPIYRHQVSGHFPMLWNSAGRICKPASERELEFYQNLSQKFPALLPFVPRFYGMMKISNVSGPEDDSKSPDNSNAGTDSNNASLSNSTNDLHGPQLAPLDSPSVSVSASESSDIRQTGSPSTLTPPITASSAPATGSSPISFSLPNAVSVLGSSPPAPEAHPLAEPEKPAQPLKRKKSKKHSNGWAFKCHEKRSDQLNHRTIPYLVLEDLNKVFHKPSILDIKLGTQQHSVDDPPSKIASKRLKCASTTSAAFGLRFCGSQIWHPQDESYTYRDKYYGRKLDGTGLVMALRDFFFNGHRVRSDVVETVLYRVKQFRSVMENQTAFQFRSSSLLIIYEGNIASPSDVSVKFASVFAQSPSPLPAATAGASASMPNSSSAPILTASQPSSSTVETPSSPKPPNWNPFVGFSDVRLIDFAHIDTNLGERDAGVLLGLDNLIQMLHMILKDESVTSASVAGALTVNSDATAVNPSSAVSPTNVNGQSFKASDKAM